MKYIIVSPCSECGESARTENVQIYRDYANGVDGVHVSQVRCFCGVSGPSMDSDREAVEGWERLMAREASDVEALKAKVEQLPIYTTIQGSGMDAQIVNCFLISDVLSIFEEGKP